MNRKTLSLPIVLFLIVAAALTGCIQESKKDAENKVQYDSISVNKTYYLMGDKENPNCNLQIKFLYPSDYSDKKTLKRMQETFIARYFGDAYMGMTPEEAVNKYTEDYLEAYKDLEKDFQKEKELMKSQDSGKANKKGEADNESDYDDKATLSAWFSYYETTSDDIAYNKNDLISFTVNFDNFTGGAHGSHSYQNYVINLRNGQLLLEEDIFIPNYQEELASIIVKKLLEQNDINSPKELEDLGFFSVEEIVPNSNFLVTGEGLTYTFNEYEIACYAVGTINVFVPFKDIYFLIKKDCPISNLLPQ